jgi:pantothenate synthetase
MGCDFVVTGVCPALADYIFIEELRRSGWYDETSQALAAFLPVKRVGATNRLSLCAPSRAQTLLTPGPESRALVILTSARLGRGRLLDNLRVTG